MKTYSFGFTPESVIRENLPDMYPMELVGQDAKVLEIVQNLGIDSHLEAISLKGRDKIELVEHKIGKYSFFKLGCNFSKDAMICLLRRLVEHEFETEELQDSAWSLRTGILSTIDVEEI